jgi:hypothetical protein
MNMPCPSCGADIALPEGFNGVQKQCMSCRKMVRVPPTSRRTPSPAISETADAEAAPPSAKPARRPLLRRRSAQRDEGPFEFERKGMDSGIMGGIGLMLIAVVWFFAGMAAGYIYFYPPVLFFIGLVAVSNALISGKRNQRSSRLRRRRG